ncbi:Putative elongator complex protein 1 [Emydomyces testavorans]|uniref:Elongator complex protein 1 n=1 Tax=Emydomyces testavorans TaxID=2070801 RepID=A0AAF0DBK8_9EURO|nr:Putative elongator complex protein 1 [Emydomyces testavorans]
MRNLRNIRFAETLLKEDPPLTATAWDPATDSVLCAFGPTEANAVVELRRKEEDADISSRLEFPLLASWDAPCPLPELKCDRILSMQYFSDTLIVCLVLEGGDIIVVREEPQPGEDKIEIVGSVDVGITAAAWAPDEELLAVTTKSNTLLYMTRDFENIANVSFSSNDLKISRHVSVGWGKKETQFQGKRAKALRDPTMPEKVDEGKLSDLDDGRTCISWRGDGAFLAVNSIEPGSRRVIRVYSREGALDSVSEPVDGLEGALSWRPAGNLIAGVQRLDHRIDVVFFERNGLRHGQFTLRLDKEDRDTWASSIDLAWNIDSTVLAVLFKDRVQLWTMGNYHYYLKQEIPLTSASGHYEILRSFRWHHEKATRCVAGSSKFIMDTDWVFDVARGSNVLPNDFGLVGVIDGKTLKLTPLKVAAIPPPMALCEVCLDYNAIDVAFSKSGTKIAVLTSKGVAIYSWQMRTMPPPNPEFDHFYPFSQPSNTRSIAFLDESHVYMLTQKNASHAGIERINLDTKEVTSVFTAADSDRLLSIFSNIEQDTLWIARTSKSQKHTSYSCISSDESSQVAPTSWCESLAQETSWASATGSIEEGILFSLSRSGSLYANKRLLVKNCTSFLITSAHLIFTTTQHLLKFVHITNIDDLEIPGDIPEADERCRSIERGARLVAVMPSIFALTLQMPRGNIETIYPRALVLAGIRKFIEDKKYRSAYLACRSHMVDMNILHDYMPKQFMTSIQLFIDQIRRVDFIDEFLSRLKDENVAETLYKDTLKIAHTEASDTARKPEQSIDIIPAVPTLNKANKVNRICDAFLSALSNRIETNLQNLITAHVCKLPPDLDAGLQLVAKLRDQSAEQAEEAIEHMCFLTDANKLFNNALGLYDLELTLLVAQQAQRDPREYLPFLQKLQGLAELRRRYEIDNHLGRYAKALKNLHALHEHEELKLYTIKHSLYREALELYKYQPDLLRDMTQLYADHLHDQSKYKEAAIVSTTRTNRPTEAYESLGQYESAYETYKTANMWQECLYCATLVPLSESQMTDLAQSLVTALTEIKDYISAATIYLDHLQDIPAAARLLCRGSKFGDACRILALHGRQSLVPDIVDSSLGETMGTMTELLADCRSQLLAQVPRIRELRVRRTTDPLGFFGGDPTGGVEGLDIPDNISIAPTDASTMAGRSMFTRYTGSTSVSRKTSKTRRREERKRARGKKGTVYEEEYLVNSVRRLVERVNGAIEEVEVLVQAMLRRGMLERAAVVEKNLDEILTMCRDCVDEVFEVKPQGPPGSEEKEGIEPNGGAFQRVTTGSEGVFWDSLDAYAKPREPPAVKEFKKLALLSG